jgi:hypothetical protein
MKIQTQEQKQVVTNTRPSVVIGANLKRESERLDKDGNIIDPRTKQIIKTAEENK